jgi:sec-independent protein translocase protein TatA
MRLGTTEVILLIVLAVIIFGGTRIAGLGKALGKSIKDFRHEIKPEDAAAQAAAAVAAPADEAEKKA